MGTRDRILDAAAEVLHSRGLARTTTKEIARAAGYSEAALYKHFRDKTDLFVAVLNERVPSNLTALLDGLHERVGQGRVVETLYEIAHAAIRFYGETFPMAASLFAEPDLLRAHRNALADRGVGPHIVRDSLTDYLAAEQRGGGLAAEADPQSAALLLLGACLQHAFLRNFAGEPEDEHAVHALADSLARTLAGGLGV